MVNLEVPTDYTFSPSEGTPHLTINHDIAADLDSTNAFEGPEKLLEVWFAPNAKSLPPTTKENGLKAVPSETWEAMLDLVNCKVLSIIKSEHVDAYLLSESSMFVFPHKIILKTCGTTTLLLGLRRLLRIAAADAGFPFHNAKSLEDVHVAATPYRVFYSRKNFLFPDKQRGPHRSWKQEVKYLDDMFENGSAYMVGKMNGDHWYLYITSPNTTLTPPRSPVSSTGSPSLPSTKIPTGIISPLHTTVDDNADETLEILMTDLDPENAKQFYLAQASAVASERLAAQAQGQSNKGGAEADSTFDVFNNSGETEVTTTDLVAEGVTTEGHALGTVVSDACGLSAVYPTSVYPEARIDAYLFEPCGFSANGVVPAAPSADKDANGDSKAAHYFTVHVTPEPNCSFASFETNVPGGQKGRETTDVIEQVVNIFKPGRFSVTLFEAKGKLSSPNRVKEDDDPRRSWGAAIKQRMERIKGYRRIDRVVHDFEDYDLVFRFYEREGWVGDGGARVGEEE